jgi:hypothetical protein
VEGWKVHVGYSTYPESSQRFATSVSGAVTTEIVDPAAGGHSSLAVAGSTVHLGYVTLDNQLKYARKVGTTWTIRDVDAGRRVDWWSCSVAADEAGGVHIGYRDATTGDVLYTVLCP